MLFLYPVLHYLVKLFLAHPMSVINNDYANDAVFGSHEAYEYGSRGGVD